MQASHYFHGGSSDHAQSARTIASGIMQSFGIKTHWKGDRCHIEACLDPYEEHVLFFDGGDSIAYTGYCCTYHNKVVPIAFSEIALKWIQHGIIEHYCDMRRWNRRLLGHDHDARISQVLTNLGVPHSRPGFDDVFPKVEAGIKPNATAVVVARHFYQMVEDLDPTITLFGSMARGDHHQDSDIDIIMDANSGPEAIEVITKKIEDLEQTYPDLEIDINLVVGTINLIYQHPTENLQNPDPNAITFAPGNVASPHLGLFTHPPDPALQGGMPSHFMTPHHIVQKFPFGGAVLGLLDLRPCKHMAA